MSHVAVFIQANLMQHRCEGSDMRIRRWTKRRMGVDAALAFLSLVSVSQVHRFSKLAKLT